MKNYNGVENNYFQDFNINYRNVSKASKKLGIKENDGADKICLRPSNKFLNPSNNSDFWPKNWSSI